MGISSGTAGRLSFALAAFIGALSGLFTALLLLMCISFILDTVQVRMVVREEQMQLFKIGAIKTAAKMGSCVVVLLFLTLGSFKAAKDMAPAA